LKKSSKPARNSKIDTWKLLYDRFDPSQEGLREALCTLGNGCFATRGAAPECDADRVHYPGSYVAGLYNKTPTRLSGKKIFNEDLVNVPNWLPLRFRIEKGEWFRPARDSILDYRQELDFRSGILIRSMRVKDPEGRITRIESKRLVSMKTPHLAAIRYAIVPQNYSAALEVEAALDGTVENTGVTRYRQLNTRHLVNGKSRRFGPNGIALEVETSHSKIRIAQAASLRFYSGNKPLKPSLEVDESVSRRISARQGFRVRCNHSLVVEKIVSLRTSIDPDGRAPMKRAVAAAKAAPRFSVLLGGHRQAWKKLWSQLEIDLPSDPETLRILRFHAFHLLQTASPHTASRDVAIPARGLHGEAYRGHIFWDEMFVYPFFTLHLPEIARGSLLYRYRRLPQARKYAREDGGYRGSMFPWQSGSSGVEETQVIHLNPMSGKWGPDHSRIQRHVSFAIAYNIWQYWKTTADRDFMNAHGAEMFLSIARFAVSLCRHDDKDGKFHTDGIMGPDEFHEKLPGRKKAGLRDNAYSNLMIVWTLMKGLELLESLPGKVRSRIKKKLGLRSGELDLWRRITCNMNVILGPDGILCQFDGYFDLKDINWNAYRKKYGNIHRMDRILKAEGKSPDEYKVSKQADALMVFYLLPLDEVTALFRRLDIPFHPHWLEKNYDYYESRTSHGSTLSKVVHCFIALLMNKQDEAWKWFREVLHSDIDDIQGGTTPEGIHTGVMGGSIDLVLRGYAGIWILEDRVRIHPNLPESWDRLKVGFVFRGCRVLLSFSKKTLRVELKSVGAGRKEVDFEVMGKRVTLQAGASRRFPLRGREKSLPGKPGSTCKPKRLLVVDSNLSHSEVLETKLEQQGHHVTRASNGKDALEILNQSWMDAVVLDISLRGGFSGFELFQKLKKKKEFAGIPIIIHSGKTGMKNAFEQMGARAFISKPASVRSVAEKIRSILQSSPPPAD
jgi:trehalose/maltose hydrolase-like predicted phosphorylase/CheY-like chemotaxis protein